MFSVYFLAIVIFYVIVCFSEIVVFNEEILLALCFFSFIFFSYNSFADSFVSTIESRSIKIESDFLASFSLKKKQLQISFDNSLNSRSFQSKLQFLMIATLNSITMTNNLAFLNLSTTIQTVTKSKFLELSTINAKLISSFQKSSINQILYPFVFKTTSSSLSSFFSKKSLKPTISKNLKQLTLV